METLTVVFQYEIRYGLVLYFSEKGRDLIAPYVRLADKVKIDHENTSKESIQLLFADSDHAILVNWGRIILKGQSDINKFAMPNSPGETPFYNILDKLKSLDGFSEIKNTLLSGLFVNKRDSEEEELLELFKSSFFKDGIGRILPEANDYAITVEQEEDNKSTRATFGPYLGTRDLEKRNHKLLDTNRIGEYDFNGFMMDYTSFFKTNAANFNSFKNSVNNLGEFAKNIWTRL